MSQEEHTRPMVSVYTCWDDAEAEVIRSVLRDSGIEAFGNSEIPHSVLPTTAGGLGRIEVYVDESREAAAREAIRSHLSKSGSSGEED